MWTTNEWRDYRLLDCGNGERLERWGNFILIRPDPVALWEPSGLELINGRCDAHYTRASDGGGRWELRSMFPAAWVVKYRGLNLNVKLMNFKHTGVFPEQAPNWDWLRSECDSETSVLNLFAYTGAATMACLSAGASVCHVDAAKGMVDWAKSNAALCNVADRRVRWIVDDCREFVNRENRRGRGYDAIIMDPPSYGRGVRGEVWKLEDDLFNFCKRCADV
ncbi:MAG: class I SAM-dependent methyltransferase, partial [Oscillospiraceae bacterium]|nr:class I SAM-dependent methyltransferase [Oscillospiraceae bacterium]